ncbi:MAG: DUF2723 domain-containing protein, partial [Verrucomicrobiota bacterium]|nr:DUF2723 domain-containing protein [Verrucomicrobiota bacterium]
MSSDQSKAAKTDNKAASPQPGKGGNAPESVERVPNLFRKVDWIAALVTTICVLIGYVLTLAPDLTLEDSGELAVGSMYAGVPHPPGYPVWTIYTWLFTVLFPVSNIAYRVAMSSAVAAAFSCGLLALIVSRGSSMMLEGIEELKNLEKKLETALCLVSGFVAGMLLGFNGFMWSQAVIVEVYTLSVLSLMGVLACLLRWMYAPKQTKFLYWTWFLFGICFTNHQTLIVATMGLEVAIMAANRRLGRDLFLGNSVVYLLGLVAMFKWDMLTSISGNAGLKMIYHTVGIGSIIAAGWGFFTTQKILTEWKPLLLSAAAWLVGALFYFYMPIASMTNPPMNWGYPRTEEGFVHALTRGQYDKTNPTSDLGKFIDQIGMYIQGAVEEYNFVFLVIGLIPFFFFKRLQKRERAWLIGLSAIYLCLAILLLVLLNPSVDRQSREQSRVFFTASHVVVSIAIGYGLSLIGAMVATQYAKYRQWLLWGSAIALGVAIYAALASESKFDLDRFNSLFACTLAIWAVGLFLTFRTEIKMGSLLALFALMPAHSIMSHWADNEQRGHLFGYWFGHDMFTPPYGVYPEMTKDAILFGGTDPGRFNPTYMIFCESFTPPSKKRDPKFDRRDVYIITQNALADGTYLSYIRAHYNRSTQVDPPFFVNFFRTKKEQEAGRTNLLAKMFVPVDRFFTSLGAKVEAQRRAKGVYPPKEIKTPTPEDSGKAFETYIRDAQMRLQHDLQFPNEPKQIKPGEDVRLVGDKISVQGQVAVMAINGLLTKDIFDKNPEHEFFLEESFPLDWMYPYLSPFGIILKINRQPLPEITQEMVDKDHEFWSKYSERLIGNWITYDTTVKEICDFAERVYLRRDFVNSTADPKFVRDDNAQKAFSKLRSAIGGIYFWRIGNSKSPQENARMFKEAEFAFKQSFAYCPYSPEAVYKYVQLLVNLSRSPEALMIVDTAIKFDPSNQAMYDLRRNVQQIAQQQAAMSSVQGQL